MFPFIALLISFSSGIIIMFCYCRISLFHENTSIIYKKSILVVIITLIILNIIIIKEDHNLAVNLSFSINTMNFILIIAIIIVIITILCINNLIKTNKKSFLCNY